MYNICFTYGTDHLWFHYNTKKEAMKKFNALKKRVDSLAGEMYSSVSMSSVSIYGEEEKTYDNFDSI